MLQNFQDWIASPFKSDMDALHWVLFVGLILVAAILWHMVLRAIGE